MKSAFLCSLALVFGGLIPAMAYAKFRADVIYTEGPETLTARAAQIVAGTVSGYTKHVTLTSEPPGPDAIPLKWVVTGRVDGPVPLKGQAIGPVSFTRTEGSPLIAESLDIPPWESGYGEIHANGRVVLFLSGDPGGPVLAAVPSANGERDLASLVRDIVAIQSVPPRLHPDRWLAYLATAQSDRGREAALRELVRVDADWDRIRPTVERLFANHGLNDQIRGFAFGIISFGITHQKWARQQASVADFLAEQFELAQSPGLAFQYVLSLKLVLRYTMEEASQKAREPVRRRIFASLKQREPALSATPELAEQFRQIRAAYPGLL